MDMRDRLKPEYAEYERAATALANAFGYSDDPGAWTEDPEERADIWDEAACAVGRLIDAAEALARATRKVANELEAELDVV